jgi:hypothetical protein
MNDEQNRQRSLKIIRCISLFFSLSSAVLLASAARVLVPTQWAYVRSTYDAATRHVVSSAAVLRTHTVDVNVFAISEHAAVVGGEAVVLLSNERPQNSWLVRTLAASAAALAAVRYYATLGAADSTVGLALVCTSFASGVSIVPVTLEQRIGSIINSTVLVALLIAPLWLVHDAPMFAYRVITVLMTGIYCCLALTGKLFAWRDEVKLAQAIAGRATVTWQLWALSVLLFTQTTDGSSVAKDIFFIASTLPSTFLVIYLFILSEQQQSKPQNAKIWVTVQQPTMEFDTQKTKQKKKKERERDSVTFVL